MRLRHEDYRVAFGLSTVVLAMANVGHLSALTNAVLWSDIAI